MNRSILIALMLLLAGLFTAYYLFRSAGSDYSHTRPDFIISSEDLVQEFTSNELIATQKYVRTIINTSGKLVEISKENSVITLSLYKSTDGVSCTLSEKFIVNNREVVDALKIGEVVKLIGECDGYQMISGVILSRCAIIKDNK